MERRTHNISISRLWFPCDSSIVHTKTHRVVYASIHLAQDNVFPCVIAVWILCICCVSPSDTSCAADALWCRIFNTISPCAFKEAVMSCNLGHVIIVWILRSDVTGKGKLANSQTKRAKVRGRLAETQTGLRTFLIIFPFDFP